MIFHTTAIRETYWHPPSRLLQHERHGPHQPLKYNGPYLKRMWPDTVIHTGAVVNFEPIGDNAIGMRFKSGIDAIQVFMKSRLDERDSLLRILEHEHE